MTFSLHGQAVSGGIAIGRAHVCIMRPLTSARPSHVACAGANDRGQLGRGSTGGDPLLFAPVPGLPTSIRTIFSPADTTCALDTSGDAWCWGKLFETQSGTPLRINGIGLDVEIMTTGGDDHALFASSIGPGSEGRAFGRNDTRQLGISSQISGPSSFPGDFFDAGSGIRHVAAGGTFTPNGRGLGHSCAVDASDRLYCWGLNEDGQAGQLGGVNIDLDADGNVRVIEKPQLVTTQVADIALGPRHTCLRTTNDRVRCFGASPDGRAGSNSPIRFLRRRKPEQPAVRWQREIVLLSYSHSQLPAVREFILGQEEYHQRRSFQEELDYILNRTQAEVGEKPFDYILEEGHERMAECFPDAVQ